MADYKKMYMTLFNGVTTVMYIEEVVEIKKILTDALIEAEEIYISEEEKLFLTKNTKKKAINHEN